MRAFPTHDTVTAAETPRRHAMPRLARAAGRTAVALVLVTSIAALAPIASAEDTAAATPGATEAPATTAPPEVAPAAATTPTASTEPAVTAPAKPKAEATPTSVATPKSDASPGPAATPAVDDLDHWLEARKAPHPYEYARPIEARVLLRRAMLARREGRLDEALRLVRGTTEMDPTCLQARWTLVTWEAARDVSQALADAAPLVDMVRKDFVTQWSLASNAFYLLFVAWLVMLLAVVMLVVIAGNGILRHSMQERLGLWASPASSLGWTWTLLLAPVAIGYGVALPLVVWFGMLAPGLKARERAVGILLVATLVALPWTAIVFDRAALPMRSEDSPLATLLPFELTPHPDGAAASVAQLTERFPGDPYVAFGAGWTALAARDWKTAETAYRDVLRRWPDDAPALDDLGSALAQQGRRDEAVQSYEHAVKSDPNNATAHFNLSQAYTQGYDFEAATRALSRASALDFDRVREYKNQPASAGALAPVPEWMAPRRLWAAVLTRPGRDVDASLPPLLRGRIETSGRRFSVAVLIALAIGLGLGILLRRGLPVSRCGNCERVVCRRCSERRRAQALCRACARVASGAASPDFARILLARERKRSTRTMGIARAVFAVLVPGLGLVLHHRVWRACLLWLVTAATVIAVLGAPWPYAARPRFGPGLGTSPIAPIAVLGCVYAMSWLGYLGERRRARRRAASLEAGRSSQKTTRLHGPRDEAA